VWRTLRCPAPSTSANAEAAAPLRNPSPLQRRINALDRDRTVVPLGGVARERFDAKSWGEAWERDEDMDATDTVSPQALYSSLVPYQGTGEGDHGRCRNQ